MDARSILATERRRLSEGRNGARHARKPLVTPGSCILGDGRVLRAGRRAQRESFSQPGVFAGDVHFLREGPTLPQTTTQTNRPSGPPGKHGEGHLEIARDAPETSSRNTPSRSRA